MATLHSRFINEETEVQRPGSLPKLRGPPGLTQRHSALFLTPQHCLLAAEWFPGTKVTPPYSHKSGQELRGAELLGVMAVGPLCWSGRVPRADPLEKLWHMGSLSLGRGRKRRGQDLVLSGMSCMTLCVALHIEVLLFKGSAGAG